MSYEIPEAKRLLQDKLDSSLRNIDELGSDLGFLREQITTLEVNIARLYNWHVKSSRQ